MPINLDLRRKYYSAKEAAEKLGISERRVRQLLAEGQIEGSKLGNTWLISEITYTKPRGGKNGQR